MTRITNVAVLFVLIGVVALRPLITETYDSAESSISRVLGDIGDPSPLRTLGFNAIILICAAMVFLTRGQRVIGIRRGNTAWSWGLGLLIVMGVVSCWFAGQKRLAINATIDWLCLPILTLTLMQLLTERWARRLLLSAVIGSSCVVVWQCYEQYFVTFDETIQKYEAEKEAFWEEQGVELDSSRVIMFEARMRARQATGFMPHSNVTASFLVLTGFVAAGLAVARWRAMRTRLKAPSVLSFAGAVVVAAGIFAVLPLTGSRGAILSAGAAGILWLLCSIFRSWIDRHRRRLFLAAWGAIFGGALAVIAYGLSHGSLPGVSLMFRWQYWTASAGMIADNPWTGVGRVNFGRHYLAYKGIESPEEVANPHNLFVQAAADWGLPGLAALVLMLFGASKWVAFRKRNLHAVVDSEPSHGHKPAKHAGSQNINPTQPSHEPSSTSGWLWFMGLSAFVLGIRVPLLGTDDFYYVYYMTAMAFIVWSIGFLIVWFGSTDQNGQSSDTCHAYTVSTGITLGLLAFLIHDIINFALFVPATATVFFALLAVPLSEHRESAASPASQNQLSPSLVRRLPGFGLCAATLIVLLVAGWPVAAARSHLREARSLSSVWQPAQPIEKQPAYLAFLAAADADPLDPTPLVERAHWLVALAEVAPATNLRKEALTLAAESVASATPRDPHNVVVYRLKMNVYLRLAGVSQEEADYLSAIEAAREALARYPQDPHGLLSLADAQAAAGRALKRIDLLQQAIDNYHRALELDGQRLEWETLRRFQPGEIKSIERKLGEVRQLLTALRPYP